MTKIDEKLEPILAEVLRRNAGVNTGIKTGQAPV